MVNRMQEGLKIYKKGNIEIQMLEDDLMIFNVQSTTGGKYQVSMNENLWLCDCDDYQWRSEREPGSYICKHLWAVLFKVAELERE